MSPGRNISADTMFRTKESNKFKLFGAGKYVDGRNESVRNSGRIGDESYAFTCEGCEIRFDKNINAGLGGDGGWG